LIADTNLATPTKGGEDCGYIETAAPQRNPQTRS
jgi:hypothetical protein